MPAKKTKRAEQKASPMRKKATAQLLRAQKEKAPEARGEVVPVTPIEESMSSPGDQGSRSSRQRAGQKASRGSPAKGAFASTKSNAMGVRASPLKQTRRMFVHKSPQKIPDTPKRPYLNRKTGSPLKASTSPACKPVPAKSFYQVVKTQTFKDFDEEMVLAEPFLVEKDGKLLRSEYVKELEEQQSATDALQKKIAKKTKDLASLEKKNKDGQYQAKVDKLTASLEPMVDKLESQQKELADTNLDVFYCPGSKPVQIKPAQCVPGLGEMITTRPKCLVPRAFFKHSAKDKSRQQASLTARVLASVYSGES